MSHNQIINLTTMHKRQLTIFLGNISAKRFLYRLTGCRDLGRIAGQQMQRLSQTGIILFDIAPIFLSVLPE